MFQLNIHYLRQKEICMSGDAFLRPFWVIQVAAYQSVKHTYGFPCSVKEHDYQQHSFLFNILKANDLLSVFVDLVCVRCESFRGFPIENSLEGVGLIFFFYLSHRFFS